jgi:hypothetical protein
MPAAAVAIAPGPCAWLDCTYELDGRDTPGGAFRCCDCDDGCCPCVGFGFEWVPFGWDTVVVDVFANAPAPSCDWEL